MALKTEYGNIISLSTFDTLLDFPVTGIEHILYKANDTGDFFTWSLIDLSYVPFGAGGTVDPVIDFLTTVTLSEAITLISNEELIPGHYYKILGVDIGEYGGTDVIVKALTTNKFERTGSGLFFYPNYSTEPIWSFFKTIYIAAPFSFIPGTPTTGSLVVGDNGATGRLLGLGSWNVLQITDIDESTGTWEDALSCTIQGYTRNIDNITEETTQTTCIWGGKLWENTSNLSGASIDSFALDSQWTVVPYDSINYITVWDEITYDIESDTITSRKDKFGNHIIGGGKIKYFPFGNGKYYENKIVNSIVDLINQGDTPNNDINFYENEISNSSLTNLTLKYIVNDIQTGIASTFVTNNKISNTILTNTRIGGTFYCNQLNELQIPIGQIQGVSFSKLNNNEIYYYPNIDTIATTGSVFAADGIFPIPESFFVEEIILTQQSPGYNTSNGLINIGFTSDASPLLENIDLGLLNSVGVRKILASEFPKATDIRFLFVDILSITDEEGIVPMKVKLTRIN